MRGIPQFRLVVQPVKADAVLVGYLGHFDVLLARRLFRRIPVVLDHLIFAADTAAETELAPGLGLAQQPRLAVTTGGIYRRALTNLLLPRLATRAQERLHWVVKPRLARPGAPLGIDHLDAPAATLQLAAETED